MGQRTETWSFISCDREGCKHEIIRTQNEEGIWNDRNWGSIQGGGRLADITFTLCDICANDLAAWLHGARFGSHLSIQGSPVSGFSAAGTAALDQRDHALNRGERNDR